MKNSVIAKSLVCATGLLASHAAQFVINRSAATKGDAAAPFLPRHGCCAPSDGLVQDLIRSGGDHLSPFKAGASGLLPFLVVVVIWFLFRGNGTILFDLDGQLPVEFAGKFDPWHSNAIQSDSALVESGPSG